MLFYGEFYTLKVGKHTLIMKSSAKPYGGFWSEELVPNFQEWKTNQHVLWKFSGRWGSGLSVPHGR